MEYNLILTILLQITYAILLRCINGKCYSLPSRPQYNILGVCGHQGTQIFVELASFIFVAKFNSNTICGLPIILAPLIYKYTAAYTFELEKKEKNLDMDLDCSVYVWIKSDHNKNSHFLEFDSGITSRDNFRPI